MTLLKPRTKPTCEATVLDDREQPTLCGKPAFRTFLDTDGNRHAMCQRAGHAMSVTRKWKGKPGTEAWA